jgi:hypothetical protein
VGHREALERLHEPAAGPRADLFDDAQAVVGREDERGTEACRVMLWSDTANGSAITACSSDNPSGTGNSIDVCAGNRSAYPPVASREVPVWMPGAIGPSRKL